VHELETFSYSLALTDSGAIKPSVERTSVCSSRKQAHHSSLDGGYEWRVRIWIEDKGISIAQKDKKTGAPNYILID
jgi:hypothetical protein